MRNSLVVVALGAAAALLVVIATRPTETGQPMSHESKGAKPRNPAGGPAATPKASSAEGLQTATFGSGCFWCSEAVFQQLKGVQGVKSGYSGGTVKNPTYDEVCTGTTGHAEVIQVTFDPKIVTYPELLEVFWRTHDPTTLNRQGADHGTQYRSVIFYHDDQQHKLANEYKQKLDASGAFSAPIVTQIAPLAEFYPAEDYHQNYYRSNPGQGYCSYVIAPKVEKFRKVFHDKLK